MKIQKQCKIEKAASKDATREILNYILIDTQDGKSNAIATDGKMMAIVPVELCDGDDAGAERLLPAKALTEARKQAKQAKESTIELNGAAKMQDGMSFAVPAHMTETKFPNYRAVSKPAKEYKTVCFNAKALYELSQAIGAIGDKITLQIPIGDDVFGALVIEEKTTGARGILMPIRENS